MYFVYWCFAYTQKWFLPLAAAGFMPHYSCLQRMEIGWVPGSSASVWQHLWPLLVLWKECQLSWIITCESPSRMTHTGEESWGRKCQLCNCVWFQLTGDREDKCSIHVQQQLQSHMNIYKLSFPQSASQGCGTWQTLHTFILSRLLIMGERHTSCDWIPSLTQGCADSAASPSSITQNKWRSISSQTNTGKNRENVRKTVRERKPRTQCQLKKWYNHG